MKPYPLDHCVLPTRSLATARARLRALGFTVAADAAHPFGTANCCVFFEDGTYLEPLAIDGDGLTAAAVHAGNAFVGRDSHYRASRGDEGFSAFALGTADADADHAHFVGKGLSAGSVLSFSRPFVDAEGAQGEASFKLAFAAPADSGPFFFTCERVWEPVADRSSLQRHSNGVRGTARILLVADRPGDHAAFLASFCGAEALRDETGVLDFRLANATISLMSRELAGSFGIDTGSDGELRLRGIIFRAQNVSAIAGKLEVAGIPHTVHHNRIVVPPAPGQGATFIFEEFDL